jgi:hypothetical protein
MVLESEKHIHRERIGKRKLLELGGSHKSREDSRKGQV